jgi:hypothetical protein
VLTEAYSFLFPFRGLLLESPALTPTLKGVFGSINNKFRVSYVQWYGAQKSEGTPGHRDSYCLAEPLAASNSVGVAVLYFWGWAPTRSGLAEERSTERAGLRGLD